MNNQETDRERQARIYPIVLREHDPVWADWYAAEKANLERLIGVENIARISHIGSTAVPGLVAKPTVDILLEIKEGVQANDLISALSSPDYICLNPPDMPTPPPHLTFLKGYLSDGFAEKVYHIHVRFPGDWDELRFRDHLIAHPEAAAEYAELKRRQFQNHEHDRNGYTAAKTDFIQSIMKKAREGACRQTMNLVIRPLTPDLASAYLDYFDHRAFPSDGDGNPNGPCYCNAPTMETAEVRRMVSEFGDDVKGALRRNAARQLAEGRLHGYLAFVDGISIGWCNAGDMDSYPVNDWNFIPDSARRDACGRTMSIVCFSIAPDHCGRGVATALLERVIADARAAGYAAVEGYGEVHRELVAWDFHGPTRLYEKAGFVEMATVDDRVVMRRILERPPMS